MNVVLVKDLFHKGKIENDSIVFNNIPIYKIIDRDDKHFKFTIENIKTKDKYIVGAMQVVYID
jgi:hypothetical protein